MSRSSASRRQLPLPGIRNPSGFRAPANLAAPDRPPSHRLFASLLAPLLLILGQIGPTQAAVAPYFPDASTVLLFHFDEPAGSTSTINSGMAGNTAIPVDGSALPPLVVSDVCGGTVSLTGFGSAANVYSSGRGLGVDFSGEGSWGLEDTHPEDRVPLSSLVGVNDALTLEAMVNLPALTGVQRHIWGCDGVLERAFQFRIDAAGSLAFDPEPGGALVQFNLATLTGEHAFVPDAWFHVAATYEVVGGIPTTKLYWTRVQTTNTAANLVHTGTNVTVNTGLAAPLVLGNEGRITGNMSEGLRGLLDEARISNVARQAHEFIFTSADTDTDGLPDSWEQQIIEDNPADDIVDIEDVLQGDDYDEDTLTNLQEYQLGTDPTFVNDPDNLDGDTLPDIWELTYFPSIWGQDENGNPDGDIYNNLEEYQFGLNPTLFNDLNDADADGLPDDWETLHFGSLAESGSGDHDSDGFTNAEELAAGTNPASNLSVPGDSDGDGLQDSWELIHFAALDQDGTEDPDGDSHPNHAEQAAGTDPNDPLAFPGAPVDPTQPTGLMVDLLAQPGRTTIPDTHPEFTWFFNPISRGDTQSAYEIIVASTAALAGTGTGDVWSSGKILSGDSVNVPHGGPVLTRGSTYFWRVRTWGQDNAASAWSKTQPFIVEATLPQTGARTLYRNSAAAQPWAGRYQPAFDTVVPPGMFVDKGGGNYFIDFGRAGFGYITLHLIGSFAGQTMEVRFGEKAIDTSVDTAPGGTIRYGATLVSLSNGDVTYEIHKASTTTGIDLSWTGGVMPFRYVELVNCPGTVAAADIRQHVLHIPFDESAASFSSSDSTLDAVWELCRYSMKATSFSGVYVDGDRERKPYEADAYINQLSHYGVDREFALARYSYEYLLDHSTWPTEWKFHFPLMAWADYMHTGNQEALAVSYDSIVAQIDQFSPEERADGLLVHSINNIVDWPAGERDGYVMTSVNTVVNAFYCKSWRILADIATVLGHHADAAAFTAKADQMQASFNSVFWNPSNELYQDGEASSHISAHANFFPMALGLVPSNRVDSVMTFLKSKRMACSVYGAQYLLEALFQGGEEDYAIGLMADDDPTYKRHWWNMLAEGSTITLEAWDNDYKSNLDWNHAWGAVPANIIPRYVLGLKPLTPGFGLAEIKPQLGTGSESAGLTHATGVIPTIRGPVTVSAENSPTTFKLWVDIPGNMLARVLIPAKDHGYPVAVVDGEAVSGSVSNRWLVLENIGSGQHAIWLSTTNAPSDTLLYDNWAASWFGTNAAVPEISSATSDPDADGLNNNGERIAGTDPTSAASTFAPSPSMVATNGATRMTLTIEGKAGRSYTLERTRSLATPDWNDVTTTGVLTSNQTLHLIDPESLAEQGYHRVIVDKP